MDTARQALKSGFLTSLREVAKKLETETADINVILSCSTLA